MAFIVRSFCGLVEVELREIREIREIIKTDQSSKNLTGFEFL
jgi:hypothetical protein